jgi:hypothetical protein
MATRYPDAPRDTISAGDSFEDFVCDALSNMGITLRTYKSRDFQFSAGENKIGFEIKLDESCMKYGHLSIEIAERTRNEEGRQWTASGILRNDNSWLYIQGNKECFWILFKPALVKYFKTNRPTTQDKFGTVRTFYMDFATADTIGKRVTL